MGIGKSQTKDFAKGADVAAANDLDVLAGSTIYDVTATPGACAFFDGNIQIGGIPTHIVVNADQLGSASNATLIGDGAKTIDTIISDWETANPGLTLTLMVGTGMDIPTNSEDFSLTGGVDQTEIDRFLKTNFSSGEIFTLNFTENVLLKNNQAVSGNYVPVILKGGSDYDVNPDSLSQFQYDGDDEVFYEVSRIEGPTVYKVGDTGPAGGKIFYVDSTVTPLLPTGKKYLEASLTDQEAAIWSNIQADVIGTTSDLIGEGLNNTNEIIAQAGHTISAALTCTLASIGGYSDWFLPSTNELLLMYALRAMIDGFDSTIYFTSTEWDAWSAYDVDFSIGTASTTGKSNLVLFRAIRMF